MHDFIAQKLSVATAQPVCCDFDSPLGHPQVPRCFHVWDPLPIRCEASLEAVKQGGLPGCRKFTTKAGQHFR